MSMDTQTLLSGLFVAVVTIAFVWNHLRNLKKKERKGREAAEKGNLISAGPQSQHPHIDGAQCIGCGTCTAVCPEGEVLAVIGGKAVIVNGYKCIGHGFCAEACPVGAITLVTAKPSVGAEMPSLTPEYETTVPNLFIAGELGGLALIKNAIAQGKSCVDTIASRRHHQEADRVATNVFDVIIVGAGPAGISASLRAIENKLNYLTFDEGELGGTVAKYPRQKLVMTSPVEFPLHGKFKKTELSKEELIAFWKKIVDRADFKFHGGEKVEDIQRQEDGLFRITTAKSQYVSRAVILAIGKSGSPRKLGVKGENLPKVMYRLIETDHYVNKRILIVGGGDSAVEAAMGLAHQVGNNVTLSYRKDAFSRLKERNTRRLDECTRKGMINVVFNSIPVEFNADAVHLETNGVVEQIPNDYVWIFAGGEAPTAFLKKIGVGFGERDLTVEGSKEAQAVFAAKHHHGHKTF